MKNRKPAPVPFEAVRRVLEKRLPSLDAEVVEAVLATVIANRLDGPPVWLELIGPPSTGKGVILEPLEGIERGKLLSKLTPQTLLSGAHGLGGKDPSLLNRLGRRPFIVIKELGTLLQGDPKSRGDIFSQLREVYDGKYDREYGNGVKRSWRGKATLIMGITPAVDRYRTFSSQLGERCLKIRFDCPLDTATEDLALAALQGTGDEESTLKELNKAYASAIADAQAKLDDVNLSEETQRKIASYAAFAATVRTQVERDCYTSGKPVALPPAPEGPYRIAKKLGLLAIGLAALRGETDLRDLELIRRIAFDCMPEPRRSILLRLMELLQQEVEPEISDLEGIVSESYARMAVADLAFIGVVEIIEGDAGDVGRPARSYKLSPKVQRWLQRSGDNFSTKIGNIEN